MTKVILLGSDPRTGSVDEVLVVNDNVAGEIIEGLEETNARMPEDERAYIRMVDPLTSVLEATNYIKQV